jgi:hypothetical protein
MMVFDPVSFTETLFESKFEMQAFFSILPRKAERPNAKQPRLIYRD